MATIKHLIDSHDEKRSQTGITFDEVMEEIASESEDNRRVIDTARMVSDIVSSLVRARVERGLSQRDLAKMCGLRQSAIARMEKLQAIPRLDTVAKIASCLSIEIGITEEHAQIATDPVVVRSYIQSESHPVYSYSTRSGSLTYMPGHGVA